MTEPTLVPAPRDIPPSRPHPAWIVTSVIGSLRNFIFAFIAILFSVRDRGIIAITLAMLIPGLAIILWRVMQWRVIRYSAQGGAITLSSGLFEKSERTIQMERIQSVDTVETPVDQLLGVQELRVSTAGNAQSITIPAISHGEADRLRDWIEAGRFSGSTGETGLETAPEPVARMPATVVRQMSGRDVLLAGVTAGRIAPALAIAAAGWRIVGDVMPDSVWERVPVDPGHLTPASVVALIGIAALLAWGLSIAGAGLSLWNFTLERTPESLIVSSGLLDRKQNTIPIQRIQAISVVEGVLRQPFGFASVVVESAAPAQWTDDPGEVRHLYPFIRRREVAALIEEALPEFTWDDSEITWQRLPARARSRYVIPVLRDSAIAIAIVCGILAVLPWGEWWYGLALLPLVPIWLVLNLLRFRDTGWSLDQNDRLFVQQRAIDRSLTVTRGRRVQMRELSSNLLQRRANLGSLTLRLATAGSRATMRLVHVDYDDGERLLASLSPAARQNSNVQVNGPAVIGIDRSACPVECPNTLSS